jgi:hypothetical protein
MAVSIDNLEIDAHYIEIIMGYIGGLLLEGKALEDEGKQIYDKLKDYKKGDIVQLKDFLKGKYSGVWVIDYITLSIENQKAPAIYSFRIGFRKK